MFVRLVRAAAAIAVAGLGLAVFAMLLGPQGAGAGAARDLNQTAAFEAIGSQNSQQGQLLGVSERLAPIAARRMISDPGLNTPATISESGRKIVLTGHVSCVKGDEYRIQASVTQSSSAALARGETAGVCTGKEQQFSATTWAYDEALFVAGPAQACALATIRTKGKMSDVFQWCRKEDVKLVGASASY